MALFTRHSVLRRVLVVAALGLSLAGCGIVSFEVSNSPDPCPKSQSTVPCP